MKPTMTAQNQLNSAIANLSNGKCTLIVVPSMTFDGDELAKIPGAIHFEERMLWLLQTLRNPTARVVYVTSKPLPESLFEYSMSLTGVTDGRERTSLISCDDSTPTSLTRKILSRQDIQEKIRSAVGPEMASVMMCHVATDLENELAEALGTPLFACHPSLRDLGSKSSCREAFHEAGVWFPDGQENLRDRADIVGTLVELQKRKPDIKRAVIKLNDSFAGGGNAIFEFPKETGGNIFRAIDQEIDRASFVARDETPDRYLAAFETMGGIVEEFIEGEQKSSPSVQCVLSPNGSTRIASTHEQILGGENSQTYLGCSFPANSAYKIAIAKSAQQIADVLIKKGVSGHISIDFVCVKTDLCWDHYAIEINLRMGGATAPISYLESVTGGQYDAGSGQFLGSNGRPLYYKSADRIQSESYKRLDAEALLRAADDRGLHFDDISGSGSLFYMLGALPTVGKLGLITIEQSRAKAAKRYQQTIETLDVIALHNTTPH
jgi:hypothetical protein